MILVFQVRAGLTGKSRDQSACPVTTEEKGKKYHRVERAFGSFGRSFSLPDDASPAKITADFKDGVLKVHLAKNEKARPRQIEVSVS